MKKLAILALPSLALLACADVSDSDFEAPSPGQATEVEVAEQALTEIATLQLSKTHSVSFFVQEELGITMVTEKFHADRDFATPQRFLRHVPLDTSTLAATYEQLAGEQLDDEVVESLEAADERAARIRELHPVSADALELPADEEALDVAVELPVEHTKTRGIGVLSQALCTEPAWDWVGDEAWFKQYFCPTGTQYCDTLDASHWRNWTRARNIEAFGFAQSHCSSATFSSQTKNDNDRVFPFAQHTVPARWVYVHRLLNTSYRVASGISTDGGNFTGLSVRTWN